MKLTKTQKQEILRKYRMLTNWELYEHLKTNFNLSYCFTTFRSELYELGIKRVNMLRWTKEEIAFLLENYQTKGNKEIAALLSKPGRPFTIKNINKQMNLLNIKRTPEQLTFIKDTHKANGVYKNGSAKQKALGKRYFPEGHIKVIIQHGTPIMSIKVNGNFVSYARYRYQQLYGEIPKGYKVYLKDCNFRNISDDNLTIEPARGHTKEERILFQKYYKQYFDEIKLKQNLVIAEEPIKQIQEPKMNLISIKIGKMIVKVKPGSDIEKIRQKYETRKFAY